MPRKRPSKNIAPHGPRQPSHLPSAIVSLVAVIGAFSEASRGQSPVVVVALLLLGAIVLIVDAWRSRRLMRDECEHDETHEKDGPRSS
jgi:F0F1-type ATP synthase assembly protein I